MLKESPLNHQMSVWRKLSTELQQEIIQREETTIVGQCQHFSNIIMWLMVRGVRVCKVAYSASGGRGRAEFVKWHTLLVGVGVEQSL